MDANLLGAISTEASAEAERGTYRRPALKDIIIYGRVRSIIKRPSIVPDNIKDGNGYYCIVDAYALKCMQEDYFQEGNEYDVNHLYFTKGSILAYIQNPGWVGKDVKIMGKYFGRGTTIRRQEVSGSSETTGISAFVFDAPVKDGYRYIYTLACNSVLELCVGDRDCRGTVLEEFMVKLASAKNGEIPYNKSLDSILPYTGVEEYEEIFVNAGRGETEKPKSNGPFSSSKGGDAVKPVQVVPQQRRSGMILPNGRVDVSKIDMKLVYHLEGQPRSELFEPFKEDIERCKKMRDEYIEDTLGVMDDSFDEDIDDFYEVLKGLRNRFVNNVCGNYTKVLGRGNVRCKHYVDKFITNLEDPVLVAEDFRVDKLDEEYKKALREGCEYLRKVVVSNPNAMLGDSEELSCVRGLSDINVFTINEIATCLEIPYSSLTENFLYLYRRTKCSLVNWLYYLVNTPYLLALISCGLSIVDCDAIYFGVTRFFDSEKFDEMNASFRTYLCMLNTLSSVCDGTNSVCGGFGAGGSNTFVKTSMYKSAKMSYPKVGARNIENNGFPKSLESKSVVRLWLEENIEISKSQVGTVLGENGSWFSESCLHEMEEIGVINTLDSFIALESNIEQEFTIYSVFEELGKKETGITVEQIDEVIKSFEESRGFNLEPLQKDGVKLCTKSAGVLSGCAGSGKTTTSDCITEVLKKHCKKQIVYCTPTGKACRRLAEVVHGTVKTIHSQFRLGLGGSVLIPMSNKESNESGGGVIYIMDEMAMCSTDLMYNVAKNIHKGDMIYFLGDIKQLQPVGNGCPFKVLMTVLPCVELGVSKRAAAGSLVNYNTSLINFLSDGISKELMYDKETFISAPCRNVDIQQTVVNVFNGFMTGSLTGKRYGEDDIQVITGYQKETKVTSIARLNPALQRLLRGNDERLFVRESRVQGGEARGYYKNDRIIYINANSYNMCRYVPMGNNTFKQLVTFGIVNGDMGKLIGVLRSDSVRFKECSRSDYAEGTKLRGDLTSKDIDDLFSRRDAREDSLRNDSAINDPNIYFVVIQVYDTDLKTDCLVMLRARGKYLDSQLVLSGADLDNLDLAYALTCHKMQGSQSPVVIVPLEDGSYSQFINRNMINTMITRSQGVVCMIGSIHGDNSALEQGRKCVSSTDSHDLLSLLMGNTKWAEG